MLLPPVSDTVPVHCGSAKDKNGTQLFPYSLLYYNYAFFATEKEKIREIFVYQSKSNIFSGIFTTIASYNFYSFLFNTLILIFGMCKKFHFMFGQYSVSIVPKMQSRFFLYSRQNYARNPQNYSIGTSF